MGYGPPREAEEGRIEEEIELLRRHVVMLKAVIENQPVGILRLTEITGFPQHKVRYSLRILEQEGLIAPSPQGAVATDKVPRFLEELRGLMTDLSRLLSELKRSRPE